MLILLLPFSSSTAICGTEVRRFSYNRISLSANLLESDSSLHGNSLVMAFLKSSFELTSSAFEITGSKSSTKCNSLESVTVWGELPADGFLSRLENKFPVLALILFSSWLNNFSSFSLFVSVPWSCISARSVWTPFDCLSSLITFFVFSFVYSDYKTRVIYRFICCKYYWMEFIILKVLTY